MRLRRLSAFFGCICILVILFILYVITDLTLRLPLNRPIPDIDDSKWSALENKLKTIENELNQHHSVVGELKSVVDEIVDKNNKRFRQFTRPSKNTQKVETINKKDEEINKNDEINNNLEESNQINEEKNKNYDKIKEYKDTGDEPPKMHVVKFNTSTCAIHTAPKTDIQMLSMYERMSFEDIDGGAWKQGWDIEYNANQWNQKNKLKVFVVPHSHNDPGWLKTFENYYKMQTKAIFTNMVEKLGAGITRKFIWAETSYLFLWWNLDATEKEKTAFKKYLETGQIEIVTGGWVMNDEANSHWISVAQQLTTGHQWLLQNLGYIPKNAWAIDPFGHSSSQPYLLKLAGFENSVIQRVHYRVKKELALNRQLEFKWRQLWDGVGKTDMFTHLMPFYSYDVPHTCGPDPKICCQFDFKRLPGNGVSCPWGVAPLKIIQKNVRERSNLLLDQWRKKAQLYRSNVVLIPLGDDFRYDRTTEWDHQYQNYEMLMDFINNDDSMNADVQFGTLEDYFREVHKEVKMQDFPVLSGDFFTYADRNQHYWSGYYTSRPFYKNMDRVLLAYIRAAEMITVQAISSKSVTRLQSEELSKRVEDARRALALFQHHDGITGTARNDVREDYAKKMHMAIKLSQSAIQLAAFFLLKQPVIKDHQIDTDKDKLDGIFFNVDDIWRHHEEIPTRITIALDIISPSKNIVLYNALPFKRAEVFTVFVSSPDVEVTGPDGKPVMAQVSPVVQSEVRLSLAANKFQLSFLVTVKPLALTAYTVALRDSTTINKYTSYSSVRVFNADYWTIDLPKMFQVDQSKIRLEEDFTVRVGNGTRIVANKNGLIQSIVSANGAAVPVNMKFVHYGTKAYGDSHSGAYLFLPDGPAQELTPSPFPEMVIVEGPFKSTLYAGFNDKNVDIVMAITLYDNPSLPQTEVEISNTLLIAPEANDVEVAMRFNTEIKNDNTFYTDLNGMQMIKRKYLTKIPLQANFYPLPAAAYIEDERRRLTVLTSTPLGVAALQQGQIEIMQDRRLSRDDNRGLSQGVMDNIRTRHTFRVIAEDFYSPCEQKREESHGSGTLSVGAHVSQQTLLQPLIALVSLDANTARPAYSRATASQADIVLASLRSHVQAKTKSAHGRSNKLQQGLGITLQRVNLDTCYGDYRRIVKSYPVSEGQFSITDLLDVRPENVFESSLTFNTITKPLEDGIITLCPMEIRSLFINETIR